MIFIIYYLYLEIYCLNNLNLEKMELLNKLNKYC